jgi:hypothetical protein
LAVYCALTWKHAFVGEDARQHLHAMLKRFCSHEAFADSALDLAGT